MISDMVQWSGNCSSHIWASTSMEKDLSLAWIIFVIHQGTCMWGWTVFVLHRTLENTNTHLERKSKMSGKWMVVSLCFCLVCVFSLQRLDFLLSLSGSSSVCWDRYLRQSSEDKRCREWALPLHEPEGETCWKGTAYISGFLCVESKETADIGTLCWIRIN